MIGHRRRMGCLAGVIVGGVFALGWAPVVAFAKDTKTLREEKSSEPQREEAARAVIERLQSNGVQAIQAEQQLARPQSLRVAPRDNGYLDVTMGGKPVRMITSYDATPIADGGLATGGATPNGGACTCDAQCAAAAGECHVAHCVGGMCVQGNAPVDTVCSNDGLFCTEERCNDVGVCVNTNVSPSIATRISPCSKQCCSSANCNDLPTADSKQNCFEASDCPGTEGCFPKRQAVAGQLYRAQCDEANDRCFVDRVPAGTPNAAVGSAVGRCCTVPGACSITDLAGCASGQWVRMRDPDDSQHTCSTNDGCPKYGSGISPDGAHLTGIGPIVPSPRRCSIGNNLCEVNADCIDRCDGGVRLNESCDTDADCPGALCLPGGALDICTADPDECQGAGTFTSIGDDYSLSNGSYMRLSEFRFRGGAREPKEIATFEFYDSSFSPPRQVNAFAFRFNNAGDFDYRIIVDCFPNCDATQAQGSPFVENRLDPPFIIPPNGFVVMRATNLRYASTVDTQFGEDDGNFFWYSTDAADVGTNNTGSMWVDGVVGNNPAIANDVLSFELMGTKIPAPLAACCNPTTGSCVDRLQWDCSFCTDPAHTPCQFARDCGLDSEFVCASNDWKGARSADEVIGNGSKVCGQTYCHGPGAGPGTSIECTGTGQGSCGLGQVCEEACEIAACCTASGCVEVNSVGECAGLSGTILGFGQRCEPNCCPQVLTGVDCCKDYYDCFQGATDTGVNCDFRCNVTTARKCTQHFDCPTGETCVINPGTQADCPGGQTCQLVCDGPDNAADPRIHAIDVPPFMTGNELVIADFRGATGTAVYTDDCLSGSAGVDFGHYQMFALDACAIVTINTCCSDPLVSPVAQVVTRGCPCFGVGTAVFADINANGQQSGFGTACNNDFCCVDGNWSVQFTLQPGTYIYQIPGDKSCSNSTTSCFEDADCDPGTWCARNNAQYEGHILARPCAPGACCGAPSDMVNPPFCSVTDQFTCQNERKYCKTNQAACMDNTDCPSGDSCLNGVFLGNKPVSPIPECDGDPCSLGACCLGPGNCVDNGGLGISFAACNGQSGAYLGGFLCSESPCPVCPIEVQDNCQSAATATFIVPSDRLIGQRRADDFRAAGSVIRRLCFHPCYIGTTADNQGFECSGNGAGSGAPPPDVFIAKIFDDNNGIPGTLIPGVPVNGLALTIDAKLPDDGGAGGSRCWRYTAPISPPSGLSVTPGECYWLEITGLGELQPGGVCGVQWETSGDGNAYSMRDTNGVYQLTDAIAFDQAFCIDTGIIGASSPPVSLDGGCGNFPVACCKPGQCIDGGTYQQCIGTPAAPVLGIPFPYITCAQIAGGCPLPANDNCANAIVPTACTGQVSNPNLGVCSVSGSVPNIMEICDLTLGPAPAHDCPSPAATCQPRPANTDAYRCTFATDNRLANTDGPASTQGAGVCFQSGANSFQADVWYRYTAPCTGTLTVHNCDPDNNTYDSMFQAFSDHSATCLPCPITTNTANLACTDDQSCASAGGGGGVRFNVTAGGCYTLRLGGFSNLGGIADAGQNISGLDLGVVCNPIINNVPPGPAPAPFNQDKNRYVSFAPLNSGQSLAFRVRKLANAGGGTGRCTVTGNACTGAVAPPAFAQGTCAAGQSCISSYVTGNPGGDCWVQTPTQTASGIPSQNVQFQAVCGLAPVFRLWTEPVVHVHGCPIIPATRYEIYTNGVGPIENPTPLAISTAGTPSLNNKLWGDNVGINNGLIWTAPNGFCNVQDVLSLQAILSGAAIRPTQSVANVRGGSSADGCLNPVISAADVLAIVSSIAGASYGPPSTTQPVDPAAAGCKACPTFP